MAHEVKYRYKAYMPIDGTRKIVHVEALAPEPGSHRLISFEQSPHGLCVLGVRYAPDDTLHLEVEKTDEKTIKSLLASFNHGDHFDERLDEIQVIYVPYASGRQGGIPDNRKYGRSRRFSPHPNPFTDEPVGNRWDKIGR